MNHNMEYLKCSSREEINTFLVCLHLLCTYGRYNTLYLYYYLYAVRLCDIISVLETKSKAVVFLVSSNNKYTIILFKLI